MKRINLYGFALAICLLVLSSCATSNQPNLYADFIGFSDDTVIHYANKKNSSFFTPKKEKLKPFDLNSNSSKAKLKAETENLKQGTNTCATYALDIALDRVIYVKRKYYKKNEDAKFYIVMLTDGIDNNSVDLAIANKRIKERDLAAYQNELQEKIGKIFKSKKSRNPFQSYVLLYKGEDIRDSEYTDEELIEILTPYTGEKNSTRPIPLLDDDIDRLLNKFTQELKSMFGIYSS